MISFDDAGSLVTLPLFLEHYVPDWDRLPMFALRLCTEVCYAKLGFILMLYFQTLAFFERVG